MLQKPTKSKSKCKPNQKQTKLLQHKVTFISTNRSYPDGGQT